MSVAHVAWPAEAHRRRELAAAGVPRLLIVDPVAAPPPSWDPDEDWVGADEDPADLAHREQTLRRRVALLDRPPPPRPRLVVDREDLVHRSGRWVALSPTEAAVVRMLAQGEGRVLSRRTLAEAAWPGERRDDRAVDGVIRRARSKLAALGVEVHGVTGAGYLLEVGPSPAA
jgi:two-component system, OmpR family, response regulator